MTERPQDILLLATENVAPPPSFLGRLTRQEGLAGCLDLPPDKQPDLILLGTSLSDALPIHALRRLQEQMPDVPLVVWTVLDKESDALVLVDAGATDFILYDLMDDQSLASRIDYAIQRHAARSLFKQAFAIKGCKPERIWDWAFELGPDFKFRWLSGAFEAKQRLSPQSLLGRTPWQIDVIDHDPDRWRQYIIDFNAHRPFASLACRLRGAEGERLTMRLWGDPVFSPGGEFLGYNGIAQDISLEVEQTTRLTDAYGLLKDMFDDMQVYRERLEADLEAARSSQQELLPKADVLAKIERETHVHITFYFEPTSELGGDIWGVLPMDEGRFAIYLADFSGHGVAAALNTFRLTTMIQEHREGRDRPADYLEMLSGRLKEQLPTGQYATILYGVVDPGKGVFRYAAAAAPRPLVVDLMNATVVEGEGRGLPLGAVVGAKFQEREMPISSGSLLVLASDALAESCNAEGVPLGKDGIPALLSQVAKEKGYNTNAWTILDPFFKFAARPLKDDLTLVACLINPV